MSTCRLLLALLVGTASVPVAQAARFTYHGELMDGDAPAQGRYDLEVRAYPAPAGAKALGEALVLPSVEVKDGRFAVELDLPEDADGMTWVQVALRASDSQDAYTVLGERQPISKANSTCPGAWALDGNTGLPTGSFLGIADAAATTTLVLRAKNLPVARFTPDAGLLGDAPRVALGSSANVASNFGATVGGGGDLGIGQGNLAGGNWATVGGGLANAVSGNIATVAGGLGNRATGSRASVAGGNSNDATGEDAAVGGGDSNVAGGDEATVPGGFGNLAGGNASFAAGFNARVRLGGQPPFPIPTPLEAADYTGVAGSGDFGSFAWADVNAGVFRSTAPNQFLVRASGGVGINTATFGNATDLRLSELVIRNPDASGNVDMTLITQTNRGYGLAVVPGAGGAAGEFFISETDARTSSVGFFSRLRIDAAGTTFVQGGAVGNLSDARLKKNVAPIAHPLDTLLALRGQRFEYIDPVKAMNAPGMRMGFIAQEVQKVLPQWVGPSGADGYLAVTAIGFEALAVEAIRDLKAESDVRIERLEAENAALRMQMHTEKAALQTRLETVMRRLERIEADQER